MTRWLVTCSYDGTNFAGWQKQTNKRSVEAEINKAISAFDKGPFAVVGCSRTDAKVHALGQCFHYDTKLNFAEIGLVKAINTYLPADIYIIGARVVPVDFHARFSAKAKTYKYLINNGPYDVVLRNYQYHVPKELDLEAMQQAATVFIGTHDFSAFCVTSTKEKENQIRTIRAIKITKRGNIITLFFRGNSFLRYMVRMMVQTLVEVGRGRLSKEEVAAMLASKDKDACRYNAPPCGLYLVEVTYALD